MHGRSDDWYKIASKGAQVIALAKIVRPYGLFESTTFRTYGAKRKCSVLRYSSARERSATQPRHS